MKVIDANLLLYAVDADSIHHLAAKRWLEKTLSGVERIGLPWITLLAFLRLSTRHGVFRQPLSPAEALQVMGVWLELPCVEIVEPTEEHFSRLKELLLAKGTGGNLTSDAHLAALAMDQGAELCSADSDFSRFKGVRWTNPLEASV